MFFRKGDYHRYLAEFASGEKRKVAATAAHEAYKVMIGSYSTFKVNVANVEVERDRCCPDRAHTHAPNPPRSCAQLLRILLRDLELTGSRLPSRQAGFRRRHCRIGFVV